MARPKNRKSASSRPRRPARPVRVLVADDHRIFLQALKALLDQQGFLVVAQAADGREAVDLARRARPDVVVLDRVMPGLNGLDAAVEIARRAPDTAMLLLTGVVEEGVLEEALRRGVRGLVSKAQVVEDLVLAIHEVRRGGVYVSPAFSRVTAAEGRLSPKEIQVLALIAQGNSPEEIAARLGMSRKAVALHQASLKKKLQVQETATLARYAMRENVIPA